MERIIHRGHVNMIPRTTAIVVVKVSSGLL